MSLFHQTHFDNIICFETQEGKTLGFNTDSLEVAELSPSMAQAILTKNYGEDHLQELADWARETGPDPVNSTDLRSIVINVTQICNLHCTYCSAGGDGTYGDAVAKISIEKTLPQLKYLFDRVGDSLHINFLGGEPLLYPEAIGAISKYVRQLAIEKESRPPLSLSFVVTTNGTLLSENALRILSEIRAHVVVSLDGPAAIQNKFRLTKAKGGSFDQVIQGLTALLKIKDQLGSVTLSSVFHAGNLEVFKTWQFLREFEVDRIELNFANNEYVKADSDRFVEEMEAVAARAFEIGGEEELRRIQVFRHFFKALDNGLKTVNYCGLGKSLLMMDARNNLYPCPYMVGQKSEQVGVSIGSGPDQRTVMNASVLKNYEKPQVEQYNCQKCWAKYLCGGGCAFTHNGDVNRTKDNTFGKKDKIFCKRTQQLIKIGLVYYEKCRSKKEDDHDTRQEK